ncbi:PaaI family thioesterase [Paenibacillus thiaminolyticus]|uniref:PaaI family thioesterase n=1 Tax=Paenibacillus thiaminolyticus TaxID=49283 RepID=A0A3A3H2H9_PANTH|nr:PaaI family thioesterase [Paenibacillus thiaminolyticus]RJG25547.1 PaaI family thioesterase [Paenibacillus thiaminolyticus]
MKRQSAPEPIGSVPLEHLFEQVRGTFWEHLGCEVVSAEPGKVVLKLNAGRQHMNTINLVHGGVLSSLLDNAMGLVTMLARPGENTVTSNLNVHFVAPLHAGELRVTADIVHETRRSITCTGQVFGADGKLGSLATATFRVI